MMNNTAAPFADGSKGDSTSTAGAVGVEVTGRSEREEGRDALLVLGLAMHECSVCMLGLWAAWCGCVAGKGCRGGGRISMGAGRGCSCNSSMGWVLSMRGGGSRLVGRTLCQEMPQRKAPKYNVCQQPLLRHTHTHTHARAYVFPPARPSPSVCQAGPSVWPLCLTASSLRYVPACRRLPKCLALDSGA